MKRILIAGTNSGCGKTTVTLAILAALKKRGLDVASCKCGPDYIDPMFHRAVLGVHARNLDPFFSDEEQLRTALEQSAAEVTILEGVMGYYDGLGTTSDCSTYTVARATQTPTILVVNARGMSASLGAILQGFSHFRENSGIVGVIFNGVSEKMLPSLSKIAESCGMAAIGCFPRNEAVTIGSRHLGLVTAQELPELQSQIEILAEMAEKYLNLDALLALCAEGEAAEMPQHPKAHIRVAVARDPAFCFVYEENLRLLECLGCEIVPFSPMEDAVLPENIQGLYLPGGYPELHLPALESNIAMRKAIARAVAGGLPTIAECGGFLYLHENVGGHAMVGVIAGEAHETKRLQRFGYTELTAEHDNLLCRAGDSIRAHEFHYWESSDCGSDVLARKASTGKTYPCIHATDTLWAGFPHLYLPANPMFAQSFVKKAEAYLCHISSSQPL